MTGTSEDLIGGALLHDVPAQHDADPVGDVSDNRDVVSDEEDRHAEARTQLGEQIENLSPHRDIQGRHRLVKKQNARLASQRPRYRDPLPLATGKLGRAATEELRVCREANAFEESADPLEPPAARH